MCPQDVRTYRNNLYVTAEEPGAPQPEPLQGAAIAFLRNGAMQGIAYRSTPLLYFPVYHPELASSWMLLRILHLCRRL